MTTIGINAHIPSTRMLDKIQSAGIKYIRCDFSWPWIEPERGIFAWEVYDKLIKECLWRDIYILAVIGYTPKWANYGGGSNTPPIFTRDWTKFIHTVVKRYPQIAMWEIWNEPNIPKYFSGTIKDYGENILAPASKIIHEFGGRVVAPGIATTRPGWSAWLKEMEWYSQEGFLDIVSIHHYTAPAYEAIRLLERGTWLGWLFPWWFPDKQAIIKLAKRVTNRVWLTEIGWSTAHLHDIRLTAEIRQKRYYQEMIERENDIERTYFYELLDDPFTDEKFGILQNDLNMTEKEVYQYLKWLQ